MRRDHPLFVVEMVALFFVSVAVAYFTATYVSNLNWAAFLGVPR